MKALLLILAILISLTGYSQATFHFDLYGDGATTLWKFPIDTIYHSCACKVLTSPTGSSGLAVSPALRIGNLRVMDHSVVFQDTIDVELYNIFNSTIPPYPLRVITRPAGYHIEVECTVGP